VGVAEWEKENGTRREREDGGVTDVMISKGTAGRARARARARMTDGQWPLLTDGSPSRTERSNGQKRWPHSLFAAN
jgi:hypothetical protein